MNAKQQQYYFDLVDDAYEGRDGTQDTSYEILMQLAAVAMTQAERDEMMKDVLQFRISAKAGLMRIVSAVFKHEEELAKTRREVDLDSIEF